MAVGVSVGITGSSDGVGVLASVGTGAIVGDKLGIGGAEGFGAVKNGTKEMVPRLGSILES